MIRYRIVERRRFNYKDDVYTSEPVFHIEQREWFLFLPVWCRIPLLPKSEQEARDIVAALEEIDNFKPKVII